MNKQEITDKANELIDSWGYLCAGFQAWQMITIEMPPNVEYWEKVLDEVRLIVRASNKKV